jgi:hypothetical protein
VFQNVEQAHSRDYPCLKLGSIETRADDIQQPSPEGILRTGSTWFNYHGWEAGPLKPCGYIPIAPADVEDGAGGSELLHDANNNIIPVTEPERVILNCEA